MTNTTQTLDLGAVATYLSENLEGFSRTADNAQI